MCREVNMTIKFTSNAVPRCKIELIKPILPKVSSVTAFSFIIYKKVK